VDNEIRLLVQCAQAGDQAALSKLYEQLAPQIYRYVYYRVGADTQLAEDLTEDVFVRVLQKIGDYEDRGLPFVAWLYRIDHNRLTDHFRRQAVSASVPIDDHYDLPDAAAGQALDSLLTSGVLTEALQKLTTDQRSVIVLRFLQGASVLETAQITGKTEDSVKKLQMRGLVALRRALGDRGRAGLAA
jgi:RNA polymerase sigma-70 factor (ECF subfamily)